MALRGICAVGVVVLLCACGDDDAAADAGADAAGDAAVASVMIDPPAPPEIPWYDPATGTETLVPAPPVLTPCPMGWREVDGACDPWPDTGPADCAPGEAHFPGEPGCTALGVPCPTTGDFADGLPDDGTVLFVHASAMAGGDGTRTTPYATIAEALAVVTTGQTIALSRGMFDGRVELPEGVTLRGACVTETTLTSGSDSFGVVTALVPATAVRDLTIADSEIPGITAGGIGAEIRVTGVRITGARALGLIADDGASIVATDVSIEDLRQTTTSMQFGRAMQAQEASSLTATRVVSLRNFEVGVASFELGSTVTLSDVAIRDTQSTAAAGTLGYGLRSVQGASMEAQRIVIENSHRYAVVVDEPRASLTLTDAVIRDTQGQDSDMSEGRGLVVSGNAAVTASRTLLARNRNSAVTTFSGGDAMLDDVIIRDTMAQEGDGMFGRGVEAVTGSTVVLRRVIVERNRADGLFVVEGAMLTAEDVVVSDTVAQPGETDGRGALVGGAGMLDVTRARFERNQNAGIVSTDADSAAVLRDIVVRETADFGTADDALGFGLDVRFSGAATVERGFFDANHIAAIASARAGASIDLSDVVLTGTLPRESNGQYGLGALAFDGGRLGMRRVLVHDVRMIGVLAAGPLTTLTAEDVAVRDVQVRMRDGSFGTGIEVDRFAMADVTRALVERTRQVGIGAQTQAVLHLNHVEVLDTDRNDCSDCPLGRFGVGIGAYADATLTADVFRVQNAALCGVQVGPSGIVDLMNGEISGAQIGACVHQEDYDIGRITNGVRYRDNDVNVETVDFPVPEPAPSLSDI